MAVISVQFLMFAFAAAALYFLLPAKCRPCWLLLASIFFYATFSLSHFLYIGITAVTTFLAARMADRAAKNAAG